MSGNHKHPGSAPKQKLNLLGFRIVPADFIYQQRASIREILFGGRSTPSKDIIFEVNPISGYISYRHSKQLHRDEERKSLALPRTKTLATEAATKFLADRYLAFSEHKLLQNELRNSVNGGKPLALPFSMIPHRRWLKHTGTFLVRNDKHNQPDHWLCKFQVEIQLPNKKMMPVLSSSIDVRIGEPNSNGPGAPNFEVVGFQSRWRPVYDLYRVEQFLPDTGAPEHGPAGSLSEKRSSHSHLDESTQLTYLLADENVPQFNLLPYEATVSGEHHVNILPASRDSLWVEFNVRKIGGKYKIQALVMGGSGQYRAHWGYWDPTNYQINPGADSDYRKVV